MGHIAHHLREERWLDTLIARNLYNGIPLWKRKLPAGISFTARLSLLRNGISD